MMPTHSAPSSSLLPLGRRIALHAMTALLNPYTLFLRDAELAHWAAAFLLPWGGALIVEAWLGWRRRGAARIDAWVEALSAKAFALQAVVLCFQWADV